MLNLDTRIPLMVQERDYGRGFDKMQDYQAKRLELDRLREQFNEEKEARLRQKQMQQGIASELQKMQQGTPAQYRTDFPQTIPTGQMPQGMTGVLAAERGQNMPTPDLFGENILKGNFDVRREMVSPAIAPKQPDIKDVLTAQFNAAMAAQDSDAAFDAAKKLKELEKNPNKYFGGLTKGIDSKTNKPLFLAMTESGVVPVDGYQPYEEPKDPKTSLITTSKGYEVVKEGELPKGRPVETQQQPRQPMTGYQKIKLEGDLRDDYRKDSANFVEISRQAKIIESSLNDDSAAGSLASATAFMKMLDPNSVVRESELAMAMKTNGALDRIGNYINVIQSGQVLTKQQKADFAKLIKAYSNASNEAQRNLNKKYSQISSDYGLDPKRVVVYDVEKDDTHGSDKKDPYKITKGMSPKYVDYLMAHKQLVEMKDYEGAKILTEMYRKGGAK